MNELNQLVTQKEFKGEGVDKWMWLKDSSGTYSVSLAYKWLRISDTSGTEEFYSKMWCGGAPLKVKAFAWKLAHDIIPSMQNLVVRNVPLQSMLCKGCNKEVAGDKEPLVLSV